MLRDALMLFCSQIVFVRHLNTSTFTTTATLGRILEGAYRRLFRPINET